MIRERDVDNIVRELGLKSYEGSYKVLIMWMAERMNIVAANKLLKTLEEPTDRTVILMVAESRDRMLSTILSRVQQIVVPGQGIEVSGSRSVEYAAMFVSWMRLLFKLNMQTLSAWVDKAAELGREPLKLFLKFAQESVRACYLKTAAGVELKDELAFGDEKFNSSFPAMITNNNVEQICNALNEAQYSIERNAYAKITLMQLSFRLSKAIKNR
jgi:DNA polymerase-3 subunit delta'